MKLKLYDYPPRERDECEAVVIHTGLSVTINGHLVQIERNPARRIATIVVTVLPGYKVTGLEQPSVIKAAELLADRAKRFLGITWKVIGYKPKSGAVQGAG